MRYERRDRERDINKWLGLNEVLCRVEYNISIPVSKRVASFKNFINV